MRQKKRFIGKKQVLVHGDLNNNLSKHIQEFFNKIILN